MKRHEFAALVNEIADEAPTYRLGGDGNDGTCDCIGLVIGALRRGGISYTGTHGSNWAARREIVELWKIDSAAQLSVGDCVFKARNPSDAKYALPEGYRSGSDKRDYYHVGVVVSISPLRIRHMTTPTAKTDTVLGRWAYAGMMRQLQQTDETTKEEKYMEAYKAAVTLTNPDSHVNVRDAPTTRGRIIGKLRHGAQVVVQAEKDDWAFVTYGESGSGYVSALYLQKVEEETKAALVVDHNISTEIVRSDGLRLRLDGEWKIESVTRD